MASRFYREGDDFYYDPYMNEFVEAPVVSGIGAPEMAYVAPQPEPAQSIMPELTPEFLQQLQQGAALAGGSPLFNAAGGLSTLQPGTLSPLDPLYDYAKTAPILSLKGDKEYENLNFQPLPDTNYQLTVGGNVVGTASNPQEVATLVDQANAISEQGGKTVDVRLQKEVQAATPTGEPITAFEDVYANQKNNNGFLDTALPAALALMGGVGLPQLLGGGFLAAGLGAGLGSIAGSLGTGASLENALIKGGISGLTAGALSGLSAAAPIVGSKVGSAAGSAAGAGAAGAGAASAFAPVANEILVQAARPLLSSALSGGIGGGLGSIGSSLVQPDPFQQAVDQGRIEARFGPAPEADLITVSSGPSDTSPLINGISGAAPEGIRNIVSATEVLGNQPATLEEEAVVTGQRVPDVDLSGIGGAISTGISNLSPSLPQIADMLGNPPATTQEESVVTGQRIPDVKIPEVALAIPAVGATAALASGAGGGLSSAGQQAMESDLTQSQQAASQNTAGSTPAAGAGAGLTTGEYVRLGLDALPLLSSLAGLVAGGGGGGSGTGLADTGTITQYAPLNRRQRPATFDPFTYGQTSGEFQFFDPSTSRFVRVGPDAVIAPPPPVPVGLKRGGPVRGIGGGQDDKIPALLSDGEYVVSAQDVSDLGDGSNEEGARRLDEMRKLIRKQAGRKNIRSIAKPQKNVKSLMRAAK